MSSRHARVQVGDIFSIPVPDGRHGYGQIIVGGNVLYVVVFRTLYNAEPDLDALLQSDILLVGWTLDALIYHGRWKIVGNRVPITHRVPFPHYKVLVNGQPRVHSFAGKDYRPATTREWELLENKTTVAPIRYQNALIAYNGIQPWNDDYARLTIEYARRRVL